MVTVRIELDPEDFVELKRRAEEEGYYSVPVFVKKVVLNYLRREEAW